MNMKTVFLNDDLEEDVYMRQSQGFVANDKSHKVCKLRKSIYELKQFSRQWFLNSIGLSCHTGLH